MKPPWLKQFLNFFFPRSCPLCAGDVAAGHPWALCAGCFGRISLWDGHVCRVCGLPLPDGGAHCRVCRRRGRSFRLARSAGLYEGVLGSALRQLKYGGRASLSRPLGYLLAKVWGGFPEKESIDGVTAVPLHFWRKRRRGYNQSELLARAFCRETGLRWMGNCLVRKRGTRSQTELGREDRLANVESAFRAGPAGALEGKNILVIDDVCTTGATLESCARALKEAGAKGVFALTVARQMGGGGLGGEIRRYRRDPHEHEGGHEDQRRYPHGPPNDFRSPLLPQF